jgi:radial spoke head protein 9
VRSLGQFFSGQHEKILIKGGGQAGKAISLNGEDFVVKAKNFTELDRLSLVVHQIDQDCHVVPVGAYKMIPTHELIDNPAFLGLRVAQATALDHYAHLRAPTHPDKKILIGTRGSMQSAINASKGRTSWTPSVRTHSRTPGQSRLTNQRQK